MTAMGPARRRRLGAIAAQDETESLETIMQRVGQTLFPTGEGTPPPPTDPVPALPVAPSVALAPQAPRPAVPVLSPPAHVGGFHRLGALFEELVASPRTLRAVVAPPGTPLPPHRPRTRRRGSPS